MDRRFNSRTNITFVPWRLSRAMRSIEEMLGSIHDVALMRTRLYVNDALEICDAERRVRAPHSLEFTCYIPSAALHALAWCVSRSLNDTGHSEYDTIWISFETLRDKFFPADSQLAFVHRCLQCAAREEIAARECERSLARAFRRRAGLPNTTARGWTLRDASLWE